MQLRPGRHVFFVHFYMMFEDSFSAREGTGELFVKHQNVVQPMYFLLNQLVESVC